MKTKWLTLLIGTMICLTSCDEHGYAYEESLLEKGSERTHDTHNGDGGPEHWSYSGETGPSHWADIEKNSDCGGQYQSPINIIAIDAVVVPVELVPTDFHYSTDTKIHDVTNNGHSIQYNFEPGDYLMYKDEKYELKQFHFHAPSEHTINGVRYPLELHMVHQNAANKYLVLAIMATEGESSTPFAFFESYLPLKTGETKEVNAMYDFTENLSGAFEYYHYIGSLTTPPCTEDVNWFILKKPIIVSEEQVKLLEAMMPMNNYRNTQPLNKRVVSTNG